MHTSTQTPKQNIGGGEFWCHRVMIGCYFSTRSQVYYKHVINNAISIKHPSTSHPAAKHPKQNKWSIDNIRKNLWFFLVVTKPGRYVNTRKKNFAYLGSFAKVSAFLQFIIPCCLQWPFSPTLLVMLVSQGLKLGLSESLQVIINAPVCTTPYNTARVLRLAFKDNTYLASIVALTWESASNMKVGASTVTSNLGRTYLSIVNFFSFDSP